jgi:hypothetical protein
MRNNTAAPASHQQYNLGTGQRAKEQALARLLAKNSSRTKIEKTPKNQALTRSNLNQAGTRTHSPRKLQLSCKICSSTANRNLHQLSYSAIKQTRSTDTERRALHHTFPIKHFSKRVPNGKYGKSRVILQTQTCP